MKLFLTLKLHLLYTELFNIELFWILILEYTDCTSAEG